VDYRRPYCGNYGMVYGGGKVSRALPYDLQGSSYTPPTIPQRFWALPSANFGDFPW